MLYIAILMVVATWFLMYRTPFGYELRMLGSNIKFARYGGVNTRRTIILAMAISGILAGLAGAHLAMGVHTKLIANITVSLGFEGIVVALLARNNPIGIPFAALAYGYLRAGADIMERSSDVSREMVLIIQAIIILLVTAERILPIVQQRVAQPGRPKPTAMDPTTGSQPWKKEAAMSLEIVLQSIFSAAFLASVLRISTPIILPALGGLMTDLSGAINIALEGIMLTSAFTGVVVSAYSHSVFLGVLAGVLAGVAISFVLGLFHLYLETDIILAGIAINILATGGTIFLLYVLTGDKGNSSSLASGMVPNVVLPLIKDIPFLGKVISGQHVFVWLAFILTGLTAIYLYKTPWGAHLRAVGENPAAAASVGINVKRTQMTALLLSGFLASFGGLTCPWRISPSSSAK